MYTIPIITSDSSIIKTTTEALSLFKDEEIVLAPLNNLDDAFEYLSIEMPELVIVNFSDTAIDSYSLLTRQMSDSWLLHGGIIVSAERIRKLNGSKISEVQILLLHFAMKIYGPISQKY